MPRPLVERHPRPAVGAAAVLPGVLRPGVVAELAGMRDGVKRPAQGAGAHVVRADVAGRRRQSLADAAADDHQVLVDDTRARQPDALRLRIAAEMLAKSMRPAVPNVSIGLPVAASSA